MFDYKKPCNDCPFRKTQGSLYRICQDRLNQIFTGPAFECHKTTGATGTKHEPQQCAGLMALLHRENRPNQIMQVATRMGYLNPAQIDATEVYATLEDAINDHSF